MPRADVQQDVSSVAAPAGLFHATCVLCATRKMVSAPCFGLMACVSGYHPTLWGPQTGGGETGTARHSRADSHKGGLNKSG